MTTPKNVNYLELSDAEIAEMTEPAEYVEPEGGDDAEEKEVDDSATEEEDDSTEEDDTSTEGDEDDSEETDDDAEEDDSDEEDENTDATDTNEDDESTENDDEDAEDTSVDKTPVAQEELDKLFAPFKANGKLVNVDNVEEAISLMQMGANYNKKMATLKPTLKLMKMLENNGLLDEGKLSKLIDINSGDTAAITELLKESKIDPMGIDLEAETEYKPGTYTVDDKQLDLDSALRDIEGTESYSATVDVIANKWDESSRATVLDHPGVIKVLNDHVEQGFYDQITLKIERDRMLGKHVGLSDLEAYKLVGDQLDREGKLVAKGTSPVTKQQQKPAVKPQSKAKVVGNKKAAAIRKSKVPQKTNKQDFDPLNLSDEDFQKLVNEKFT